MAEGMNDLLAQLREFDALRDNRDSEQRDQVEIRTLPHAPPEYANAEYLEHFPKPLRDALADEGIERLYAHQADAIERIRTGKDVVLEAPTASGKTLCFNIPLILRLMDKPHSHAMMIHPMKALSKDQRRQFEAMASAMADSGGNAITSWIFDGDTDKEHRDLMKRFPPSLLLTNPEMVHYSFLGWSDQWEDYLRKLRFIIIDEIHEYRGYFGTNVALLFRRFLAKLKQLGVRPQLVLATATCGNAQQHAKRLTGRDCELVRAESAMRPERHFTFINPDIPDFRFHQIYRLRIVRAALACMAQGLSTLVFCPSRKFAEQAAHEAKRDAVKNGLDPESIAPYRSGYETDLRSDIEQGLRNGDYQIVFSTNALEIGIDIGRLDACILAGFPDNAFSAWQRIGRVGRSWRQTAYVLFYALNNPFDRFYAENVDAFLGKPLDQILIGVDNQELIARHVPYLVHEIGGELDGEAGNELGDKFRDYALEQTANTRPIRGRGPGYQKLSIRGGSNRIYTLTSNGQEIGTISDVHLFREAYVGAVYNHFGRSYRVVSHGAEEVELEPVEPHYQTEGIFYTVVNVDEMFEGGRYAENLEAGYGQLTVIENFAGYRLVDTRTDEVVEEVNSDNARSFRVRGFWLGLEDFSALQESHDPKDLFGLEQLLRIGVPFVVPCDRHDLGTFTSGRPYPSVYLYETVPGGIGVAEKVLEVWDSIIREGQEITERCECRRGCPSCLVPPRIPSGFDPPKKDMAIAVSNEILTIANSSMQEQFDPNVHGWRPVA